MNREDEFQKWLKGSVLFLLHGRWAHEPLSRSCPLPTLALDRPTGCQWGKRFICWISG